MPVPRSPGIRVYLGIGRCRNGNTTLASAEAAFDYVDSLARVEWMVCLEKRARFAFTVRETGPRGANTYSVEQQKHVDMRSGSHPYLDASIRLVEGNEHARATPVQYEVFVPMESMCEEEKERADLNWSKSV